MNYKDKIKMELNSRRIKKEDVFVTMGSEIRDRRLSLSRTLSSVASDICSISYLCKIEKNKILPNKYYLREICNRLDVPDEKFKVLLSLKATVEEAAKAYFFKNYDFINNAYNECSGIVNYRYKIIELIYFISNRNMVEANVKAEELMKLVSTMTDADLSIFSLFHGVLTFYNQDFLNAIEELSCISFDSNNIILEILSLKYKFYSYYLLNDPCCIFEYNTLINKIVGQGLIDGIDELYYIMALYLLKNRCLDKYKDLYKIIRDEKLKKTLSLATKLILNPKIKVKDSWLENVRPFYYYLGLINYDFDLAKRKIEILNYNSFDIDFNMLMLQYLVIDDDYSKYRYIINVAIPSLERNLDGYLKRYFLNELSRLSSILNKYKAFSDAYKKISN